MAQNTHKTNLFCTAGSIFKPSRHILQKNKTSPSKVQEEVKETRTESTTLPIKVSD